MGDMRVLMLSLTLLAACTGSESRSATPTTMQDPKDAPQAQTEGQTPQAEAQTLSLGAGCFWCTEAVYEQLDGILDAVSGYMGGHIENPTYAQVCSKQSGHVEVTQLTYDPSKISAGTILEWFWKLHDPTSMDRQGGDAGPQYRSVIFFHDEEQKAEAERQISALNAAGSLARPIVTEVRPAATFWPATQDHQDFYRNNPNQAYCRMVISPKLKKLNL